MQFIKRAQRFGFTLQEIEELLALRVRPDAACDAVDRKTREKLALVRQKIRDLKGLEQSLTRLAATCDGSGPIRECPILLELEVAQ